MTGAVPTRDGDSSEALYRAVVETVGDAIVVIDHGGCIRSVNHATERIFGYTAAELFG